MSKYDFSEDRKKTNEELGLKNPIGEKKSVWELVKKIEEAKPDKRIFRHDEAIANLLVNFGPEGRHIKGITHPDQTLIEMIISVCTHYEDKLKKYDEGK